MKRFSPKRPAALLLALCLLVSTAAPAFAAGAASGISASITPGSATMQVGQTQELIATCAMLPAGADVPVGATFRYIWEGIDSNVFTLVGEASNAPVHDSTQQTDKVTLTAKAPGTSTISLTIVVLGAGNAELYRTTASCTITVAAQVPTGIAVTVNKSTLNLKPGGQDTSLTAAFTAIPTDAALPGGATYRWASDTPTVATVTGSGNGSTATVSALTTGSAKVTVTVTVDVPKIGGGVTTLTGTAECIVTVSPADPTLVTVTPNLLELDVGGAGRSLTAVVSPSDASQTVVWSSSDSNVAAVESNTGLVTGVRPGTATITATAGAQKGACTVTVKGIVLNPTTMSMVENESRTLNPMIYGLTSSSVVWTSSAPQIVRVSSGVLDALSIGSATITATVSGTGYSASCQITVGANSAGVITESANASNPLSLSNVADRIDSECRRVLGASLSYVSGLSVLPSEGVLFHGYVSSDRPGSGVGGVERYYYTQTSGERRLSDVTFVPDASFGGTSTIRYTGVSSTGRSFSGIIQVSVAKTGDVTYSGSARQPIAFRAEDFNAISVNRSGQALEYVSFVLPTEARGVLYYNYSGSTSYDSKVSSNDRFYRGSSPSISKVTFVPAADFTGNFTISYTARDMGNNSYSGRVTINVAGGGSGDVTYSVNAGSSVRFVASDFNSLANRLTGGTLSYVNFTLPDSNRGTLYYNYRSSGSYDHRVSASNSYYRSGGNYSLGNVYFVPATDYSGTLSINFTGRDTNGERFSGIISITVKGRGNGGDVSYTTPRNTAVRFATEDFNEVSRANGGYNLDWVQFTTRPTSGQGGLYYNYGTSGTYDHQVSSSYTYYRNSSYYLSSVSFVPYAGYTGTVTINFTAQDTSGGRFVGTVTVQVGSGSGDGADVSYTTAKDSPVTFRADDFNQASRDYNGNTLSRVRFNLPASNVGVLYYNYRNSGSYDHRVTDSNSYYRNSTYYLDQVTFVPASGYSGTASIGYTGYDSSGSSFSGTVTIRVGSGGSGVVSYTTRAGEVVALTAEEFNTASRNQNGNNLNYMRFNSLPSSSVGALYYNYRSAGSYESTVTTGKSYYRSSTTPYIYNITFVPATGYVGTTDIPFTGWDSAGISFTGTLRIRVGGGVSGTTISYTTEKNKAITFSVEDFNEASRSYDSYNLNYVNFTTLPTSSKGTLYYNYRSAGSYEHTVSTTRSYYRSGSPILSGITFVPNAAFMGTVEIPFTAKDAGGGSFNGKVTIQVGNANFSGKVSYTTTTGRPVTFDSERFATVCKEYDGYNLNYVRFTLPKSAQGTLHYNYRESNGTSDNKVSSSASYYRNSSPYLYNVTFVPSSGYSGTVDIEYTGRDTNGGEYKGVVSVTVNQAVAKTITYATSGAIALRETDFDAVCRELMGEELARVRFTPPSGAQGVLYYGYTGSGQFEGMVDATTEYGRERTPYLSKISFVPARGYAGMVPITYTGEDANGNIYTGKIEVTVTPAPVTTSFTDMGNYSWAVPAVEYLYDNGVVKGVGDGTRFGPNGITTRGDFALMIVRAFKFPNQGGEGFSDIPSAAYYADAVVTARALGIVQGDGGVFRPTYPVTRQDAMLMLQRAMRVSGRVVSDGTDADLAAFADSNAVAAYARPAVGAMVRLGVVQGDGGGRLNAGSAITRAEMAVILYRAMTL